MGHMCEESLHAQQYFGNTSRSLRRIQPEKHLRRTLNNTLPSIVNLKNVLLLAPPMLFSIELR